MDSRQRSLFDPPARLSDPLTAHWAAAAMTPGNAALLAAIYSTVQGNGPLTAFEIVCYVMDESGDRWSEGTIRTACKRAGLVIRSYDGTSPRGQRCAVYDIPGTVTISPSPDIL